MTDFSIDLKASRPDRVFVEVDRRFDVAIVRTGAGLAIEIYPRSDGELWSAPFTTFGVDAAEIIAIEQDREEQP